MAFDSTITIKPNPYENGCLMDSDLDAIKSNPSSVLKSSWVPKEYTGASLTGTGFTSKKCTLTFIPVQVVADKSIGIDAYGVYRASVTCQLGATGTATHTVCLNDLCPSDTFVELKSVNIMCTRDSNGNGYPNYAGVVIPSDGIIKSNALQFYTWNTASTAKTVTFDVIITVTAAIDNIDFGLGELFPNV